MSENAAENLDETPQFTDRTAADRDQPLSAAVIDAVADAADVDPAELGTPLYDKIDPDALDSLFADRHDGAPRGSGHVVFDLLGYEVTVYSDGYVVVRD
ncbi:HalOD1 output domain-containing protein [Halorussus sp. AFM4]|uniref:HalOD1 output domain-containing protein n=1 Tax=Halorussus sp. AFM4 TaxID=3421651 RepID=UPI003EBDA7C2